MFWVYAWLCSSSCRNTSDRSTHPEAVHTSSEQSIQTLLNSKWRCYVRLHSPLHSTTSRSAVNCFYSITLIFHLIHILCVTTNSFDISPLWNCRCFINACNPAKRDRKILLLCITVTLLSLVYFNFFKPYILIQSRAEDVAYNWNSLAWCKWKHFTTT